MKLWRIVKIVFVLAILGGGYAYWRSRNQDVALTQALGTVERGDLVVKVTISGVMMPRRHALIAAPYNGYVQKLYVKIGDRIQEGAPVVSVAQAIGGAHEEVFPLRSPLSGVVAQVWRREGEYVAASAGGAQGDSGLVRIDDVTKFNVESNVPEVEIGKLRVGLPVLIRAVAVASRTYTGRISEIALAAREQAGYDRSRIEFPITITVNDQDEQIKSGMSVVIDIIVREAKNALTLPHEYVQRGPSGYFVTTASGQKKPVEVGLSNEEAFEIKSGVELGEQVRQVDFLAVGGDL